VRGLAAPCRRRAQGPLTGAFDPLQVATDAAQNGRTDVRADRIHTSPALRGGGMGAEPLPYAGGHPLENPIPFGGISSPTVGSRFKRYPGCPRSLIQWLIKLARGLEAGRQFRAIHCAARGRPPDLLASKSYAGLRIDRRWRWIRLNAEMKAGGWRLTNEK
jgi:hypothetical protein